MNNQQYQLDTRKMSDRMCRLVLRLARTLGAEVFPDETPFLRNRIERLQRDLDEAGKGWAKAEDAGKELAARIVEMEANGRALLDVAEQCRRKAADLGERNEALEKANGSLEMHLRDARSASADIASVNRRLQLEFENERKLRERAERSAQELRVALAAEGEARQAARVQLEEQVAVNKRLILDNRNLENVLAARPAAAPVSAEAPKPVAKVRATKRAAPVRTTKTGD